MPEPKIVLLFHTHNRSDCLIETVESFYHYNDMTQFEKVYLIDDFSTVEQDYPTLRHNENLLNDIKFSDPTVYKFGLDYAKERGLELYHRNEKQRGCLRTYGIVLQRLAQEHDANTLVMYIQNDWASLRAMPLDVIKELHTQRNVCYTKLWGEFWEVRTNHRRDREFDHIRDYITTVGSESVSIYPKGAFYAPPHTSWLHDEAKFMLGQAVEIQARRKAKSVYKGRVFAKFIKPLTTHIGVQTPYGVYGYKDKNKRHKKVGDLMKELDNRNL